MPLDSFFDEVLGRRPVVLHAARCRGRRDLLGDDPERAILDAYAELAPKITSHAATLITNLTKDEIKALLSATGT